MQQIEQSLVACLLLAQEKHKDIHEEILNNISLFRDPACLLILNTVKVNPDMYHDENTLAYFVKSKELNILESDAASYIANILSLEASPSVYASYLDILKDANKRRSLLKELLDMDKDYIKKRNDIISKLRDTSVSINEEEITLFIEGRK